MGFLLSGAANLAQVKTSRASRRVDRREQPRRRDNGPSLPRLQEQEASSEHQHSHEDGTETGNGTYAQTHRRGPEAANPSCHRQDYEDEEGAEASAADDGGPEPAVH